MIRFVAVFLILLGLTGILRWIVSPSAESEDKLVFTEVSTTPGEMKELILPDQSIIWIGANSKVRYNEDFGLQNREVFLEGEALFDVKSTNTESTFSVKIINASVQVHGTKFIVSSFKHGNKNEVVLLEGKVQYQHAKKVTSLSPGEFLTDNHSTGELITKKVPVDNFSEWVNGKVYFEDSDLEDLVSRLENWYGVHFVFKNEDSRQYKFSGSLNRLKSVEYNLRIIELTNKIKFKQNEKRIVILNKK